MGELYSIIGLFCEIFPGVGPWSGHFIKGGNGNPEKEIVGQLIDFYGPSKLEGFFEKDKLEFKKQYEHCNYENIFNYKFFLKDGLWQGEVSSPNVYCKRKAICKVNLCLEDLDFKKVNLKTPEGYAKALIERMVKPSESSKNLK